MLEARQGAAIGVLYELTWRGYSYNEESRQEFASIVNEVKSKQRKRLDDDEKAPASKMAKIMKVSE